MKPSEMDLSRHVTTNLSVQRVWKKVCEGVGVSQHDMDAVSRDYGSIGESEVFFQCLRLWLEGRAQQSKPATWDTLLTSLAQAGVEDVARYLAFDVLKIG